MISKTVILSVLLLLFAGFANADISMKQARPNQLQVASIGGKMKTPSTVNTESSVAHKHESVQLDGDLEKSNSDVALETCQEYIAVLTKLGDIHFTDKELKEARNNYEHALKLQRNLMDRDKGELTYQRNAAIILIRLGEVCRLSGNLKKAIERYQESLTLMRLVVNRKPENHKWQFELAIRLCNSAHILREGSASDVMAAMRFLEEAFFRLWLSSDGDDLAAELAERQFHDVISICSSADEIADDSFLFQLMVAALAVEKEDYSAASATHQKAIQIFRQYQRSIPGLKSILADELTMTCWYACLAGDFSLAVKTGEEAVSLLDHDNPCPARGNLAHAYLMNDQFARAKELYMMYADVTFEGSRDWNQEVLADFQKLRKAGIHNPDMAKIEAFMKTREE